MADYEIVGGVVQVNHPAFFETWMDRTDFLEALCAAPTPEASAMKRLVVEFETALARMMVSKRVDELVDGILEEFIVDDYIQHDPNVPGNGRETLAQGFRMIPLGGPADVPPPPVCLLVEGDLVCLMMQKPLPDPGARGQMYDWFIPTIFRVRDGKLAEHWGAFRKGDTPLPAPDAV
jgi:predicted SnoaL-like aldol condensation-catalyzing enzyme